MEQQKIFRQRYTDNLISQVISGEAIELFRNNEFQISDENLLIMPHIEKPLGLLKKMDSENDFSSAVALYEAYKGLSPLEAADPRFWNYLSTTDLYTYVSKRWPNIKERKIEDSEKERTYIMSHFLQNQAADIMRSHLSGLWWAGHLSIDENESEDKSKLTKVLFWNQTLRTRTMGVYLLARKKDLALGFLDYCIQRGKDNFGNFENEHQQLTEYLNLFGGAKPLPFYSRKEIKQLLLDKFPIPVSENA
jgi:hypothetical protein